MKSILLIAALLSVTVAGFAGGNKNCSEQTLNLTGTIADNRSSEALAGACISLDGKKYYSDLDGQFAISGIKAGKREIKVELISYQPVVMEVEISQNKELNISLPQNAADTNTLLSAEHFSQLALK